MGPDCTVCTVPRLRSSLTSKCSQFCTYCTVCTACTVGTVCTISTVHIVARLRTILIVIWSQLYLPLSYAAITSLDTTVQGNYWGEHLSWPTFLLRIFFLCQAVHLTSLLPLGWQESWVCRNTGLAWSIAWQEPGLAGIMGWQGALAGSNPGLAGIMGWQGAWTGQSLG